MGRSTGRLSSHCGHLLPGGRSSPKTEGIQSHLSLTGWTSHSLRIRLSQQNQVPAFLVEGQTTIQYNLLINSPTGVFQNYYHVLALKVSDLAREWQRVDSMGQRGPFIDTSLRGALLPSRGHDCVFGPHAVLLPVRDITCLKEAHGDCKKHHLPVRGTYGLLEAALACER